MSRAGASATLGNLAGTGGGGAALSNDTPQPLGSAGPGTSDEASRADHVHAMPSAADVGALGATAQAADSAKLAGVTPTAAGLALLDDANAAAQRVTLGLGTAATANTTDFDAAGAAAAAQAASQPLDADLTAIAALTSAADRVPYATGAGTWSLATFTAAGRALVDDADAAAQRVTLGLGDAATKSVGTTAGTVAAGDDSRFTDSRTPTAHAASHWSGGSDAIKLDDLAAPDDNTDLDVTTSAHGLVPKAPNDSTKFLRGDATWAAPSLPAVDLANFGDGSDGVVSISSGTTTLTRPMFYSTLTISGTGAINTALYPIACSVECDLSNAPAGAITVSAGNGNNGAAGGSGGSTGTLPNAAHLPSGAPGQTGGAGSTTTGAQGTGISAGIGTMGGGAAAGGAGGAGASGAGGSARGAVAPPNTAWQPRTLRGPLDSWLRGATLVPAGMPGNPGSGGGGDGSVSGGGGGGSGAAAGFVGLWAKLLRRGGSTAAGAIRANGGNGGAGGSPASGNAGGGGGAGGGAGGVVYVVAGSLAGSSATNMLQATGGTGGTGGTKQGTGVNGGGGNGGHGGMCVFINLSAGTISTDDQRTTAGNAASGTTGGSGATAQLTV